MKTKSCSVKDKKSGEWRLILLVQPAITLPLLIHLPASTRDTETEIDGQVRIVKLKYLQIENKKDKNK